MIVHKLNSTKIYAEKFEYLFEHKYVTLKRSLWNKKCVVLVVDILIHSKITSFISVIIVEQRKRKCKDR